MIDVKSPLVIAAILTATLAPCAWAASRPAPVVDVDDDAGAEGDERPATLDVSDQARLARFQEPAAGVRADAAAIDPGHVVPAKLLQPALAYYQANAARITNKDWLTVVDFSRNSAQARMFLIDMKSGKVQALHVAHGSGSDPRGTGTPTVFSNADGSNCSSLGFYLTAETYDGKHGYSCRLDGLSETNSHVRARSVVIHGADYVHETDSKQGRSWGCLAVSMTLRTSVIDRLKGGSLIYAGR